MKTQRKQINTGSQAAEFKAMQLAALLQILNFSLESGCTLTVMPFSTEDDTEIVRNLQQSSPGKHIIIPAADARTPEALLTFLEECKQVSR